MSHQFRITDIRPLNADFSLTTQQTNEERIRQEQNAKDCKSRSFKAGSAAARGSELFSAHMLKIDPTLHRPIRTP